MGVARFLFIVTISHQIDQLGTDIADRCVLVSHVHYAHVGDNGELLVLILQNVKVAVEPACDFRYVGQNGGDLTQVYPMEGYCQILKHRRVLVLGIEFHTCLVI